MKKYSIYKMHGVAKYWYTGTGRWSQESAARVFFSEDDADEMLTLLSKAGETPMLQREVTRPAWNREQPI